MNLHRWLCRCGQHVWYENFRYAPQGFASTHYVVMYRCFVCGAKKNGTAPFEAEAAARPDAKESQ